MAEIMPFPSARRVGFVRRQAQHLAAQRPAAAERMLAKSIERQRHALAKGLAPETVDAEMRALELAIRAALWRAVLTPGDAA